MSNLKVCFMISTVQCNSRAGWLLPRVMWAIQKFFLILAVKCNLKDFLNPQDIVSWEQGGLDPRSNLKVFFLVSAVRCNSKDFMNPRDVTTLDPSKVVLTSCVTWAIQKLFSWYWQSGAIPKSFWIPRTSCHPGPQRGALDPVTWTILKFFPDIGGPV